MNRRKINDALLNEMLQEGKTYKEIGAALGVSAPAICKRVRRIKLMNPPDSFRQLTQKEQKFVMGIVEGKSRTQSVLEAFDCSSRASAKAMQHELSEMPKIQQALTEMGQRFELIGKGRGYRAGRIGQHMESNDPVISLKAVEMACKLSDDFPATKNLNANINIDFPHPVDMSKYLIKYDENGNKIDD